MRVGSRASAKMMDSVMDPIRGIGVSATHYLQTYYKDGFFLWVSWASDRKNTLFIFLPLLFQLRSSEGTKLIWVAAIGDWLNLVFKWILFEGRPYWWVHETQYYANNSAPHIEQYPMTCETGPGSPSGHAMGTASLYYTLVTSILAIMTYTNSKWDTNKRSTGQSWYLKTILWMMFWGVQACVCLSRVFIAAHFPHQVILGVIMGMIVAEAFNRIRWIYNASMKNYLYVTLFLTSVAVGFYLLVGALGVDLLSTMDKAQKWCARAEWIQINTSSFAILMRSMGTLFGLGLGLHSPLYTESKNSSAPVKALSVIVCVVLLHLIDSVKLPTHNAALFYLLYFCKSAAVPLSTVSIIPYCVNSCVLSCTVYIVLIVNIFRYLLGH